MLQLIKNPTEPIFMSLLSNSNNTISLCAPYIKKEIVNKILHNKKEDAKLVVITTSNLASFVRRASDIEAIEALINAGVEVYNHQQLHAKIYSFDSTNAIITSSNLTYNGLYKNYEYGVLIDDSSIVSDIDDELEALKVDELSGTFDLDTVDFIKNQISFYENKEYTIVVDNDGDEQLQSPHKYIENLQDSWIKDVYKIVNQNMDENFTLQEMYCFENFFQERHPNNHNIKPKIRQMLQQLRDKGLIKFIEPGIYKKLLK